VAISKSNPLASLALARSFLQRLLDNDQRLKNETLFWLNTFIKTQLNHIITNDIPKLAGRQQANYDDPNEYQLMED